MYDWITCFDIYKDIKKRYRTTLHLTFAPTSTQWRCRLLANVLETSLSMPSSATPRYCTSHQTFRLQLSLSRVILRLMRYKRRGRRTVESSRDCEFRWCGLLEWNPVESKQKSHKPARQSYGKYMVREGRIRFGLRTTQTLPSGGIGGRARIATA